VLVLAALAGLAGCSGSLAPPNGGSDPCLHAYEPELPAPPVAGTPCRYSLPLPPCDFLDTAHIDVKVDGVEIWQDSANGWSYADATLREIDIHGPSCDALTSGTATAVAIVYLILI
jgi:hypothetical protein